jgi:hypothetical protein
VNDPIKNYEIEYSVLHRGIPTRPYLLTSVEAENKDAAADEFWRNLSENMRVRIISITCED